MNLESPYVGTVFTMTEDSTGFGLMRGDTFFVAGLACNIDTARTSVQFFWMPYTRRENTTMRFPGGRKAGLEGPIETLKREWRQEVKAPHSTAPFEIHIHNGPLVMLPERDQYDSSAVHFKMVFLINEIQGMIRNTYLNEPSGTVLGAPRRDLAEKVIPELFAQGNQTKAHAIAAVFALRKIVKESNPRFEDFYAPLLEPYVGLMEEIDGLMQYEPRNIERYYEILDAHKGLFR